MVAAFLAYAVISMAPWIRKSTLNYAIFLVLGILGFIVNSPILFPLGIILGGFLSAKFNKYELPQQSNRPQIQIKWKNLVAFAIVFLVVGGVGLILSQNSEYLNVAQPIILFENTYRIGSLSFGGGNTLAAMSHDQYVVYHNRLTPQEFNNGLGLLQALPGPNFNFMVYVNSMAMKSFGYDTAYQFIGCLIGLIAVFMPGTLMVLQHPTVSQSHSLSTRWHFRRRSGLHPHSSAVYQCLFLGKPQYLHPTPTNQHRRFCPYVGLAIHKKNPNTVYRFIGNTHGMVTTRLRRIPIFGYL
jgi:chromate transport protein ChrA